MTSPCTIAAAGNTAQETICQEMIRRYAITATELRDRGGILNTAVFYANTEYVSSLPVTPWTDPRTLSTSFVNFLDRKEFVIPWYVEKTPHVNRLAAAAQSAQTDCVTQDKQHCVGESRNVFMANAMAGALLMGKYGGWNVQIQFTLKPERLPDAVLGEQAARCSEWLTSLMNASLFVGGDVRAQVIPGDQYHLETYWVLNDSANKMWNLKLYEGPNTTDQATIVNDAPPLLTPADTVVAISINRILSSEVEPRSKYMQLVKLKKWAGTEPIRNWLRAAIEVYANNDS